MNETVSNMKTEPLEFPSTRAEEIHYRVVSEKELEILHPLFKRLGWPPPDPDMCKVVVAEAGEGEGALICGFQMVQFVVHAEPMWLHADMRGMGVAEGLVEATIHYIEQDCKIKRYVCVAKPGSFAARLAEKYGMRPYPGQVWVRQIE